MVRTEELLVSGLVGVSLSQHAGQLTLQLFQLWRTGRLVSLHVDLMSDIYRYLLMY